MRPENVLGGISEDSDTDSDGSSNVYSTPDCLSDDMSTDVDKMHPDMSSDLDVRRDADFTDSDEEWVGDDADDEDYHGPPAKRSFGGSLKRKTVTSPGSQTKKNPSRKSRALRPGSSPHFASEVKAAEALLRLHMNELENAEAEAEVDENVGNSTFGSGILSGRKGRRASL
jgi:hypothetical protein